MNSFKYMTDPTLELKEGDFVKMRKGTQTSAQREIKKGLYLVIGDGLYQGFLKCLRTDGVTVQINRSVLELVRK